MDRYFSDLLDEYKTNRGLRTAAVLESGIPIDEIYPFCRKSYYAKLMKESSEYMSGCNHKMRGSYDNGIYYGRRFRLTKTYHKGLAHSITVRINRLIKRRLKQRMSPVKAKRSGTEVHIFVARGNYEHLDSLLPSIYHTTNIIYKYFEKGYNI